MILLCDLDGVVWLAHQPIPGSVEALGRWMESGHEVVFVTNNSSATIDEQEKYLATIGINSFGRVVSSSTAAGRLVHAGERVFVVGGPGIAEAVKDAGAVVLGSVERGDPVDAVVVGIDREFSYSKLTAASIAVRAGARFVATNHDPTYPTPTGLTPGGGAIVAAVAYASETVAIYAGKPQRTMFDAAKECGRALLGRDVRTDEVVVVGDRLDSDGTFAHNAGVRFCHVRSGVDAIAPVGVDSHTDLEHAINSLMTECDG